MDNMRLSCVVLTYLCTSDKAGFFSNKTYDSYKCWTCTEFSEAFTFLMENIYVQFGDMVYQQIVGIPMGTNCAPLIADLFLYCYERDFMSNLQKSKRFDLIDKFNDTSRYLDDIFTIDNPEFAEHIPDIYPRELQLNKANTSDKETSFLDLNIKVVGSNIHTSVYDKRDDFGFPIVRQNRSTEGCSRLERSVDMTRSGKNGLKIRTNASPKRDRTRCPEE